MRCLISLSLGMALASGSFGWASDRTDEARDILRAAFPEVQLYTEGAQVAQLYGTEFGYGMSAEDTANAFVQTFANVFGVAADDLAPGNSVQEDMYTVPVMYDAATETYRFTMVCYRQYRSGWPVYGADLRLLVRNEPGYALVLANSALRDLGDYVVPAQAAGSVAEGSAHAAAAAFAPGLVNFSAAELVIWPDGDGTAALPRVAIVFVADNGQPASGSYARWRFVADAASGALLHSEDLIIHTDVTGYVHAKSTPAPKADICTASAEMVMKYAKVAIGTTEAYTNVLGTFTIPNGGSAPVTVISYMSGRYFNVSDLAGGLETLATTVTPPGPAYFMHNAIDANEYIRAEVNAYIQANVVRDWALAVDPNYPTINTQTGFQINVNLNSVCNAYYDGSSINFYRAGGGCPNTGYSSVVHHEYGHHLVDRGGSGQGAYGEGMADTVAALIANDSILGYGFEGNCSTGLRDANNTFQYPCSGEIHYCGQLISGCVWSTRAALQAMNPFTFRQIIANLTVNSIKLHTGDQITPAIYNTYVALDGGYNGPHFTEITTGFGAHNMLGTHYILTVNVSPLGSGNVTLNPPGGWYVPNTTVQLTANPASGYHFDHWTGALSGSANPTNITMSSNRTVTAVFGLLGDMNCDGIVDFGDINPFVLAVSDAAGYQAAYPDCLIRNGDCNADGLVTFDDINPFVAILSQ